MMSRLGISVAALALAGAAFAGSAGSGPASAAAPKFLAWQVSAAGNEAVRLAEAIDTVDALLSSAEFWKDFRTVADGYPQIFVGPDYQQAGLALGMADTIGAIALLRNSGGTWHVFDAIVGLTGTYYASGADYVGQCANPAGQVAFCRTPYFVQNYSNMKAVTHGIGLYPASGYEIVSIEIGREIFDRYNSLSLKRKSCTFNTLAHEWTHTIGKKQASHWTITVDTNIGKPAGVPFLSQLVGSTAQCSWLQSKGEIGADDAALRACVTSFGTEGLQIAQCV